MKNFTKLIFAILFAFTQAFTIQAQDLTLTGVMDFTVPGGGSAGKAIHVTATDAIADLSAYGVSVASNGNGADAAEEYTFPAISVNSGDDILLARDTTVMLAYLSGCSGEFEHVLYASSSVTQNGDDAIQLWHNGVWIESFGDPDVDGTGETWEYVDSWAYRTSTSVVNLSTKISDCGDFDAGPTAWPYVLVAATTADGASSQGSQTFTMNVTSLPTGGANVRVAKTTANGNWFFGPPVALALGSNSLTVGAVTFDRSVKFQFSSGDAEFDDLSLNGVSSDCPLPPPPSSLISACGDFDAGPTAWPYVLVATTVADGASSQLAQTFTMNVTDTANGASFRVVKTTANGNWFFGPPQTITLGSNSITVAAVTFDRSVKFQFSSGDVEFDFLSLNGDTSSCVSLATLGCTDSTALNYNPLATIDDSSCIYCTYGCMDSLACNYDPTATCDDGSCLSIYGCTDSLATNYDPLATCEDSSCVYGYSITFQLDLRGVTSITYTTPEVNGMFNGWCGSCNPLEDLNGDSIWETTLLIDPGTYEYKYSVDNFTTEENLFAGDSCTVSNFGFTNRTITVDRDTVLAPVCWELCGDCDSGPSSYNVTFRLDMSEYVGPPYTTPEVNGTFNNWCGSCWAMEDADGDNVWEFTALIGAGDSIQFKYSADNWNIQEELDSSLSCVFVGFDPGAPNGWGYVNRLEVIDSEKVLDVVCWQECVECQGTSSFGDSPTGNLLLYPNPSTGSVIIRSPENISRCTVYSVLGETISSEEMGESTNEHKINIAKNGLYYVSIHTEKGVFTNKITIQN